MDLTDDWLLEHREHSAAMIRRLRDGLTVRQMLGLYRVILEMSEGEEVSRQVFFGKWWLVIVMDEALERAYIFDGCYFSEHQGA